MGCVCVCVMCACVYLWCVYIFYSAFFFGGDSYKEEAKRYFSREEEAEDSEMVSAQEQHSKVR